MSADAQTFIGPARPEKFNFEGGFNPYSSDLALACKLDREEPVKRNLTYKSNGDWQLMGGITIPIRTPMPEIPFWMTIPITAQQREAKIAWADAMRLETSIELITIEDVTKTREEWDKFDDLQDELFEKQIQKAELRKAADLRIIRKRLGDLARAESVWKAGILTRDEVISIFEIGSTPLDQVWKTSSGIVPIASLSDNHLNNAISATARISSAQNLLINSILMQERRYRELRIQASLKPMSNSNRALLAELIWNNQQKRERKKAELLEGDGFDPTDLGVSND